MTIWDYEIAGEAQASYLERASCDKLYRKDRGVDLHH
jgi:hypothetical protein